MINDYADRNFDLHVHRTQKRPPPVDIKTKPRIATVCEHVISFFGAALPIRLL